MNELVKPRYEVIADFPHTDYKIGDIVDGFPYENNWAVDFKDYPAIFRKLSWWEHRKSEEMPEYLKSTNDSNVCKVLEHFQQMTKDYAWCLFSELNQKHYVNYKFVIPATEAEYTQYTNKVNNSKV